MIAGISSVVGVVFFVISVLLGNEVSDGFVGVRAEGPERGYRGAGTAQAGVDRAAWCAKRRAGS